ncbi:hypothetical protein PFY10_18335 [Chryseobacterium daecheongense]|nr:hypothetical protein PFY10_18335 [Chryseobacterium daecheongense]
MKVELIPVIEITNYDQDIPTPSIRSILEYADEWENYHISINLSAGYTKQLKPYFKGSSFYKISEISDADLLKIIKKKLPWNKLKKAD